MIWQVAFSFDLISLTCTLLVWQCLHTDFLFFCHLFFLGMGKTMLPNLLATRTSTIIKSILSFPLLLMLFSLHSMLQFPLPATLLNCLKLSYPFCPADLCTITVGSGTKAAVQLHHYCNPVLIWKKFFLGNNNVLRYPRLLG